MGLFDQVITIYGLIGPAGVVLAVLAVLALHLVLKNWFYLYMTARDFHAAAKLMSNSADPMGGLGDKYARNPVVSILDDVMKTHGRHSNDLRAEVAYLFHRHFSRTLRDLSILKVIALISPMLGLLGTLLGLTGVFKTLASTTSMTTSMVLAAGIWEAILTTIMGLTVAIPTIMANYLMRLRLKGFHLAAIEYGYRFLDSHNQDDEKPIRQEKPIRSEDSVKFAGKGKVAAA
ncbi:MAG: MotA/TolQ/ExbB proton channel family protein [Deltaproteobacteria bacterium]|jgi:biopolymer transport protein ExbB|nr:MotA/TolQ/ExbB proton channel family protein [Deltaproteobacteria bacterium]